MDRAREDKKSRRAQRKALTRIHAIKAKTKVCEQAREEAKWMLEDYAERMRFLVECGEIGSRRGQSGEEYPQMRVIYWGEVETGAMTMMVLEVDYGWGHHARVGMWGTLRSLWECPALTFRERVGTWRRASMLGDPEKVEEVWAMVIAALRALSCDIEHELEFEHEMVLDVDLSSGPGADEASWRQWVAQQGEELAPWGEAARPPTELEWDDLGVEARDILERVRMSMSDSGQRRGRGPEAPKAPEGL